MRSLYADGMVTLSPEEAARQGQRSQYAKTAKFRYQVTSGFFHLPCDVSRAATFRSSDDVPSVRIGTVN
jgi:hypothetical protein